MTALSRPRFYALVWGQFYGLLIIILGMLPYWLGIGGAIIPLTVTIRVIVICVLILASVLIPFFMNSAGNVLEEFNNDVVSNQQPVADDPSKVRNLLWGYMYGDFILLTYLIHITGGIAGSMFAGIYLMLPPAALLLRLDAVDVRRTQILTVICTVGILTSFLMSHYHYYEFNAESFEHAFDIAVTAVTIIAMILPLFEIALLRSHVKKE